MTHDHGWRNFEAAKNFRRQCKFLMKGGHKPSKDEYKYTLKTVIDLLKSWKYPVIARLLKQKKPWHDLRRSQGEPEEDGICSEASSTSL